MSGIGNYGIKRPADVSPNDIEVVVVYTPSRNLSDGQTVTKFIGGEVIQPVFDVDSAGNNTVEILGGLYNLELPSETFNQKGFYNILIRPRQIRATIEDCGDLLNQPNVKGLVFDTQSVDSEFISKFTNNGLNGYRIEYLNDDGSKLQNTFNIITTSFLVEPVSENNTNSSQKNVKYSFNDGGSLLYCTVTPNVAPSFRPTARPFIGFKGQNVILTNTSFNPKVIEVELVDYDLESLAIGLFGDQTKSVTDGIYTLYDFDGNIYAQFDLYEINGETTEPLYEVRVRRSQIDTNKSLGNIVGG